MSRAFSSAGDPEPHSPHPRTTGQSERQQEGEGAPKLEDGPAAGAAPAGHTPAGRARPGSGKRAAPCSSALAAGTRTLPEARRH